MTHQAARRAKIIATLGPASSDPATIRSLIQAGMRVARINFSHGTREQHAATIAAVREAAREIGQAVAVLQDLQGPKIRTGEIEGGAITLHAGDHLTLTSQPVTGTPQRVSVDFAGLEDAVRPGGRILLDDGNLELQVESRSPAGVETRVVTGGVLKPHKGVNLPGADLQIPALTAKDRADLEFGIRQKVDAVALSFVRRAQDVRDLQAEICAIAGDAFRLPVIAKLERPEALDNLEAILEAADGVMVARGDLGVEMSPERVPIEQKRIITLANRKRRVVITATQMLESMIEHPRPTRAEASDVANAIFDGSDLVMLSGETAVGAYPVQAVETMARIIAEAEAHMTEWGHFDAAQEPEPDSENALYVARAARELAKDRDVAAIAVFTVSGRTARLVSKMRPQVPVLAFTPDERTCRQMAMLWGVTPFLISRAETVEMMLAYVEDAIRSAGSLRAGQEVVLVAGFPIGAMQAANFVLLHTV